jgi:hypothetical protein
MRNLFDWLEKLGEIALYALPYILLGYVLALLAYKVNQ